MAAPRPPPARLSGVMVPAPIQDLEALRALTALFKEQRNRETAPRTIFQRVLDILKKSSHAVELACRDPSQVEHLTSSLQLITECFRCLRNACIECSVNQNSIRNLDTIGVAVDLILLFRELRVEQESLLTAFRCGLQFLGNIASRNEDSQSVVWVHAFPELFLSCLNHPDKKIVAYSSMILFTSLNSERMKELEENLNIAIDVVEAHQRQPESEWPFLIITDHFLKSPELVKAMYAKMSNQERVTLLDLMIAKIVGDEPLTKDDIPVFLSHAELIASTFVNQCKIVLKLTSEQHADDEEALATIRLLDVLCEMTANTDLLSYLQVFPGLLERVIDLLRLIHVAGNDTTNIFSTSGCVKAEGDVSNVAEGFKSHLIRLIGNLCYKNKDNQDKVNELDGIPLILDSCSIDDSNPFLTQWVVYAIRNLTEDNSQNQDLIAKMEQQGLADASLLKKMGLEVEKRGDRLILKSTSGTPPL
ncbi:ataxin-10 isoform X2 [Panthera pardus]|uniref:Ataxin-10 n=1 Tax=Panthera pardus TaxID=9691 RepID=A0A9W2UYB4_PANPR|nr:ataxin-10 isoform X1 [Panthera leo]XP_053751362.1 ataxin-10 isoform X2 [Panthera pardus]XP_058596993.1 ataxin-10 isoform X1 [Neofelis nebulosa]